MVRSLIFFTFVLMAGAVQARELHVIGGFARGADIRYCTWLDWGSDVLFYNRDIAPQPVRVLNVSNGPFEGSTDTLVIPSRAAVSMRSVVALTWRPGRRDAVSSPLWVWRFEVPDAVEVTSFLELVEKNCAFPEPRAMRGQITLPTFDSLVPPGEEQVFLGTDLGHRERRVNVAIYNAAAVDATAEVTVRRICDGAPLATKRVTIPPDTVIQHGRVHDGMVPYWSCAGNSARGTYVTVVVDQPSLAWVSALANDEATSVTLDVIP